MFVAAIEKELVVERSLALKVPWIAVELAATDPAGSSVLVL